MYLDFLGKVFQVCDIEMHNVWVDGPQSNKAISLNVVNFSVRNTGCESLSIYMEGL